MIEDVYEPLARYRDEFKEKFSRLAREKFEALVAASGIDVEANRRTVKEIGALEAKAASAGSRKFWFGLLMTLAFVVAAGAAAVAIVRKDADPALARECLVVFGVALTFALILIPPYRKAAARLVELKRRIDEKMQIAWDEMEPLNASYTWDITPKLIEATVPRLAFDPYFTVARLASLREDYGWDDSFNEGKSVLFSQSGVINGNPFVFGECLAMSWGTETYHGTKDISWMDWETDAKGRRRLVRRTETLHASVSKPIPVYAEEKTLIYGNEAAPALSFSREPSGLTGSENGLWGRFKAWRRLRRLRAFSRNLDDDSNFTLMANEEFEMWFNTMNRDNEVEYRVLFTPVAQRQMMLLMKDTDVGFGDDFRFRKARKLNFLRSDHLDRAVIDTDPARFRNWDFDAAAEFFQTFNETYFKNAYFSLAPLLAIPAYQQLRPESEIWKGVLPESPSAFWEHEALANYHGEAHFKHPESITRNLLKTKLVSRGEEESVVAVTAHGFRGEDRIEYVRVHGGDGNMHDVPVHWTEYLAVQRTRNICITERAAPSDEFRRRVSVADVSAARRSILSYLIR